MKQLLKISKKDAPADGAPFTRISDGYDLKLPESSDNFRDITIALVNFSIEKPQLLNIMMNVSSALIANSTDPMKMLEQFGGHVRENIRLKEQSQNNE